MNLVGEFKTNFKKKNKGIGALCFFFFNLSLLEGESKQVIFNCLRNKKTYVVLAFKIAMQLVSPYSDSSNQRYLFNFLKCFYCCLNYF